MTSLIRHHYGAIRTLARSMSELRRLGIGPGVEAFDILSRTRSAVWQSVGLKQPKVTSLLLKILGLSPGVIKVFHDSEYGFLVEARASAGSPPVHHYVTADVAATILKGELTHELEAELMTPDPYLGE